MQSALWYALAFWIIYCIWPVTSLTISHCVNHLYIKNRVRNRHAIARPASKNKHVVSCYQVCASTSQALWNSKLRLPADVIGASPWQWDEVRCKYFKSQLSLSNLEAVETHDISQPYLWGHFKITSHSRWTQTVPIFCQHLDTIAIKCVMNRMAATMGVLVLKRPSSHALDYNIPSQNGNPKSEDSGVYYYYSSFVWSTWTQTPKTSAEGGKKKGKYVYIYI